MFISTLEFISGHKVASVRLFSLASLSMNDLRLLRGTWDLSVS